MIENARIDTAAETAVEIGTGTARGHQGAKGAAVGTTTDLLVAIATSLTTGAGVGAVGVALVVDGTGKGRGKGTATRTNSTTSDVVVIRRHLRRESQPPT